MWLLNIHNFRVTRRLIKQFHFRARCQTSKGCFVLLPWWTITVQAVCTRCAHSQWHSQTDEETHVSSTWQYDGWIHGMTSADLPCPYRPCIYMLYFKSLPWLFFQFPPFHQQWALSFCAWLFGSHHGWCSTLRQPACPAIECKHTLLHLTCSYLSLQLGCCDFIGNSSPVDTNSTTCSKPKLLQWGI